MGTVFSFDFCQQYLASLTGSPLSDFALIAISEFLSFVGFLRSRAVSYRGKLLSYVGENSNSASWIKHRKPKNRVAQYLVRISNRLEAEYNFAIFACFISLSNNKICDELSRFVSDDPAKQFGNWGLSFIDVLPTSKWFLAERLSNLSLILPTDFPDRVRAIMQFVEKRMVRSIPECVKSQTQFVFFGDGLTGGCNLWFAWNHMVFPRSAPLAIRMRECLPWQLWPGNFPESRLCFPLLRA